MSLDNLFEINYNLEIIAISAIKNFNFGGFYMLFNISAPKGKEPLRMLSKIVPALSKCGRSIVSIKELMELARLGLIQPYCNNRGGPGKAQVGSKTVESVRMDFHDISWDGLVVSQIDDDMRNKYDIPREVKGIIADGHCGLMGLFQRAYDGNLTKDELNATANLNVIPSEEFLTTYTHKNIQSPQSSGQTLGNPDLAYGEIIDKIYAKLDDQSQKLLRESAGTLLPPLAYIIECWDKLDTDDWSYPYAFSNRMIVKKNSIQPAGSVDIKLKSKDIVRLSEAISFYCEYIIRLTAEKPTATKCFATVRKCGPWFGVIVIDWLSDIPSVIPKDKKVGTLVNQSMRKIDILADLCPSITKGSYANIRKTINDISQTLRKH